MNKPIKYIIGIDAGASNTEVMTYPVSSAGYTLKIFPPVNLNILGEKNSIKRLIHIIRQIIKKIGICNISAIVIGIAGARSKKDRDNIKKNLKTIFKIRNIEILPDTEIALASFFDKKEKNCGILIAGTGSILYYRDGKGKIERIGGWGRFIGDEGGGYWIGREALNRLAKFHDGLGKKTKLENVLDRHYDIKKDSIIKKIYHENFEIPRIAKHVFSCAESGDEVSVEIIKEAAEHLANHLTAFKKSKVKIALMGSLFTKELLLHKYLRKIVKKQFPNVQLIKADIKPVWGAVKLGKEKTK